MVAWDRVSRHLAAHGYLRGDGLAGPLAVALLRRLAERWRRHAELALGIPVLAGRTEGFEERQQAEDAVSELALLSRTFSLEPPFGLHTQLGGSHVIPPPQPGGGHVAPPPVHQSKENPEDDAPAVTPGGGTVKLRVPQRNGALSGGRQLTLYIAVPPDSAADWLQTLRRRRRIWWRELADNPGNYSSVPTSGDGADVVFSGELVVERLLDLGKVAEHSGSGEVGLASLLQCRLDAGAALWAVCADCLRGSTLRLQESVAPYRRAVSVPAGAGSELRALALHLTQQLRAANLSVFPGPVTADPSVECAGNSKLPQGGAEAEAEEPRHSDLGPGLTWLDGCGVPFCVLLSEETLRTGLCQLRSRDTGLCQQTHVSQLTNGVT